MFQYESVCRSWRLPAERVGYSCVRVYSKVQAQKLPEALQNSKYSIDGFVKSLVLHFDGVIYLMYLQLLSKHTPSVEKLQVELTSDILYQKLIEIRRKCRWLNLRYFEGPKVGLSQKYFECAKLYNTRAFLDSGKTIYGYLGNERRIRNWIFRTNHGSAQ